MFISFQLIDDVLDFTSCADRLGKPTAADLKLGLATGPVLFACRQVSQQNSVSPKRRVYTALHSTHRGPARTHQVCTVSDERGLGSAFKIAGFSVHRRVLSD